MKNYIFNGINAPNTKAMNALKRARLKQIAEIKESNSDNAQKKEKLKKIKGFENLNSYQIQALLGIKRKEYTPEQEIENALKTMLNQKKLKKNLSDSPDLKITPYEEYDENGNEKLDFKMQSINFIVRKLKQNKGIYISKIITQLKKKLPDENDKKELDKIAETVSLEKTSSDFDEQIKKAATPEEKAEIAKEALIYFNIQCSNKAIEYNNLMHNNQICLEDEDYYNSFYSFCISKILYFEKTPAEEPVEKPAEKPAEKPVEKPVEKLVENEEPLRSAIQEMEISPQIQLSKTETRSNEIVEEKPRIQPKTVQHNDEETSIIPTDSTVQQPNNSKNEVKTQDIENATQSNANTTISIVRPKKHFYEKETTIELPDTTNKDTTVLYTQDQYTIPKELKTKLLGIKSLAKHKDDFNMNSLICLNTGLNGAPIYAMELKDNVKLKNEKKLDLNEKDFIKTKLFGQNRLIYRMADGLGNIKNYVVLDSSITNKYTTNQYAQKILQNKETELQLGNVSSTFGKIMKTENALCEQIKSFKPAIFNGTILPPDSQKLLKLFGLDVNQTFQTNNEGEILTKDGVKTGVGSKFDDNGKLVNFCTLNRGNDKLLPGLKKLKNSLCNFDIPGSLQSSEKSRRSRFIVEIKGGCFYLKSESDRILINIPVSLYQNGRFAHFGEEQDCNFSYEAQNLVKQKSPTDKTPQKITISTTNDYKEAYIKQAYITNTLRKEPDFYRDTSGVIEDINNDLFFKTSKPDKEKIRLQFKSMKEHYSCWNNKALDDHEGLLDKCFWLYKYNEYKEMFCENSIKEEECNKSKEFLKTIQQTPSYYITNLNDKFNAAYKNNNIDEMLKIAKELIEYYQHTLEIMQSLTQEAS